jgi:hypothetical protein
MTATHEPIIQDSTVVLSYATHLERHGHEPAYDPGRPDGLRT